MSITLRRYQRAMDFERVSDFLTAQHLPGNRDGNWLQPTWEYMHSHPALDETSLDRIGLWEENGRLVGVAHYESSLGEAFFELHPQYPQLKMAMLDYAEAHLYRETAGGERYLNAYINDFDPAFEALVQVRGYQHDEDNDRPMSQMDIPQPFHPDAPLPAGFRLKSLADENNLHKMHRVLWRGFNHPGEPPADGIKDREKMQSGPHFRKDLTIVTEAPNGDFASYCGTWYDSTHQFAYLEPVATDRDFRRMGLGKAAVLEGIRRCAALGAQTAFVGSDQLFYQSLGFRVIFTSRCWVKKL